MTRCPSSLREAAKLDGASEARIFFQVVIPMSRPILVYTIINSFMMPWTDFVMAKMILNSGVSSDWTVAIGLYNMLSRTLVNNYFALFCAGRRAGIHPHLGPLCHHAEILRRRHHLRRRQGLTGKTIPIRTPVCSLTGLRAGAFVCRKVKNSGSRANALVKASA